MIYVLNTIVEVIVQYLVTSVAIPLSNLTLKHLSHSLQQDVDHEILHVPPLGHKAFLGKIWYVRYEQFMK